LVNSARYSGVSITERFSGIAAVKGAVALIPAAAGPEEESAPGAKGAVAAARVLSAGTRGLGLGAYFC
jgi:hypothetical protein